MRTFALVESKLFLAVTGRLLVNQNWINFAKTAKLFHLFNLVRELNGFDGSVSEATQLIADFVGVAVPAHHSRVAAEGFWLNSLLETHFWVWSWHDWLLLHLWLHYFGLLLFRFCFRLQVTLQLLCSNHFWSRFLLNRSTLALFYDRLRLVSKLIPEQGWWGLLRYLRYFFSCHNFKIFKHVWIWVRTWHINHLGCRKSDSVTIRQWKRVKTDFSILFVFSCILVPGEWKLFSWGWSECVSYYFVFDSLTSLQQS